MLDLLFYEEIIQVFTIIILKYKYAEKNVIISDNLNRL